MSEASVASLATTIKTSSAKYRADSDSAKGPILIRIRVRKVAGGANKDEWLWGYRVKLIVGITHLLVVERS